jgi:hypothetical protein
MGIRMKVSLVGFGFVCLIYFLYPNQKTLKVLKPLAFLNLYYLSTYNFAFTSTKS